MTRIIDIADGYSSASAPTATPIAGFTANSGVRINASGALEAATQTNGQILIGSTGAKPVVAALTATANQTTITNGAGTITVGTVQSIGTASSPQFTGLNVSGLSASLPVKTDGSSNLTAAAINLASVTEVTGQLPITALADGTANQIIGANAAGNANEFKTVSGTANQVTVTHGVGTVTLSTPQDIATSSSVTFGQVNADNLRLDANTLSSTDTNGNVTISPDGTGIIDAKKSIYLDSGTQIRILDAAGGEYVALKAAATTTSSVVYSLPPADGTNGQFLKTDGAAALTWATASGGGGGASDDLYSEDFETGIGTWATYKDAAGVSPVDGTGGSPTVVTFAGNGTTPIDLTADAIITKSAANGQGEGVSNSFTLYNKDVNYPTFLEFYYKTSVNYVTGDMRAAIYDVTNGALITAISIEASSGIGVFRFPYTKVNASTLRIIFHVSSTNANAYTMTIDRVRVRRMDKVIAKYTSNAGQAVTNGNIIDFEDLDIDTHSAVTTGASWKFTAPFNDAYMISANIRSDSVGASVGNILTIVINTNGSPVETMYVETADMVTSRSYGTLGTTILYLKKDQYFDLRFAETLPAVNLINQATYNRVTVTNMGWN